MMNSPFRLDLGGTRTEISCSGRDRRLRLEALAGC